MLFPVRLALSTRPPTRSRASNMTKDLLAAARLLALESPDRPPPIMATSTSGIGGSATSAWQRGIAIRNRCIAPKDDLE